MESGVCEGLKEQRGGVERCQGESANLWQSWTECSLSLRTSVQLHHYIRGYLTVWLYFFSLGQEILKLSREPSSSSEVKTKSAEKCFYFYTFVSFSACVSATE